MQLILALIMFATLSLELSEEEKKGLYYCTETGVVVAVINESKYVTIVFGNKAPIYFRKSELFQDLLKKISNVVEDESYKVTCIQGFWRDDWQKVYDEYKKVTDKLVDIEKTQP